MWSTVLDYCFTEINVPVYRLNASEKIAGPQNLVPKLTSCLSALAILTGIYLPTFCSGFQASMAKP